MNLNLNNYIIGKRTIFIAFINLSLLALVGCSGKESRDASQRDASQRYANRGNVGNESPVEAPRSVNDTYYPGRILGSPEEAFQDSVYNLISSFMMDPADSEKGVGRVSGVQGEQTGIWFNGLINISGGSVTSDSFINVLIWDEFAGEETSGGSLIPGIKIGPAYLISGEVDNYNANLRFYYTDNTGEVLGYLAMVGSYNNTSFTGTFHYSNETFLNPKYYGLGCDDKGACGKMGGFSIPTCDIFNCSSY